MTMYLINSNTGKLAAELVPNTKVTVAKGWIKDYLDKHGIVVDRAFKNKHKTNSSVSREDGEAIFARAFKELYVTGLEKQGFYWSEKHPSKIPSGDEVAKEIVKIYKQSLKGKIEKSSKDRD